MGKRGKKLTKKQMEKIMELYQDGDSQYEISRKMKISRMMVRKYIDLKDNFKKIKKYKKRGRKPILNNQDKCHIKKYLKKKSGKSAPLIKKKFQFSCNVRTLQRTLNSLRFRWSRLKKKPELRKEDFENRRKFAKKYLNFEKKWNFVWFSDEKKFNLDGPDGFYYYWRDLDNEKGRKLFSKRPRSRKSFMVWGAFCSTKKSPLIFLKNKVTSKKYVKMIKKYFLPISNIEGTDKIWFQQDNAPIHTSNHTLEHLNNFGFELFDWPPYSPDLNPIENIWSILSYSIYNGNRIYKNTRDLKKAILKAWDEISEKKLKKLVGSMENRLEEVIINRGDHINY